MRWSPDERSVVVSAYDESVDPVDHYGGIYQIDIESGATQLLMSLPSHPGWWYGHTGTLSADGSSLFYVRQYVEQQGDRNARDGVILIRDLSSGADRELHRDPTLLARPFSVSPNGQQLVFANMEGNGARLMFLDVMTGSVAELVSVDQYNAIESVAWGTDQRHVMYVQSGDSGATVWRAEVGGEPELLFESFPFQGAVSPGATRLAYTVGRYSERHMVMENLKSVLDR
jgi:Tol biopolymer transport system component